MKCQKHWALLLDRMISPSLPMPRYALLLSTKMRPSPLQLLQYWLGWVEDGRFGSWGTTSGGSKIRASLIVAAHLRLAGVTALYGTLRFLCSNLWKSCRMLLWASLPWSPCFLTSSLFVSLDLASKHRPPESGGRELGIPSVPLCVCLLAPQSSAKQKASLSPNSASPGERPQLKKPWDYRS